MEVNLPLELKKFLRLLKESKVRDFSMGGIIIFMSNNSSFLILTSSL